MSGGNGQQLLPGWAETELETVVEVLDARRVPINAKERAKRLGDVPYYGATGQVGWIDDFIFDETLVLLGEDGAPFFDQTRHVAYVVKGKSWVNNHAHVLRAADGVNSWFLSYQLNVVDYHAFVTGTTRWKLNQEPMRKIPLKIPPAAEQSRIADALDELFSDLDAGVAALTRARENLQLYRASVLKAAVEGALTPEWRAEHPQTEPASELLKRILAERRRRWEADQLAQFKVKAQHPPRNWKATYKEPITRDTSNLPPLPEGWCWCSGDALFGFITSGSRGWAKFCTNDGALFIRMGNLDHDSIRLDLGDTQRVMPPEGSEGLRTRVQGRDILISITADVGMIALAPDDIEEAYINQHVALARPVLPGIGSFVAWYLASPTGGQLRLKELQRGATKVGLGLDDIRNVAVPLPPLAEQEAIVEAVEDQLSVVEHLEADLDAKLKGAHALRQSILRRAITGQLVPQDANDEPASELLKRIAADRQTRAREATAAKGATKSHGSRTGRRGRLKTTQTKDA